MRMMRIRMTHTTNGSPDGLVVRRYEAGEAYTLPARLARNFLEQGVAIQDKAIDRAPNTKEQGGAGGNEWPSSVDELPRNGPWYVFPDGHQINSKERAEQYLEANNQALRQAMRNEQALVE